MSERETNGSSCSSLVRKKLTFDDDENDDDDNDGSDVNDALSSQSWYRQSSDSGDWLHGADLQLSQEEFDDHDVEDAHPVDDIASFKGLEFHLICGRFIPAIIFNAIGNVSLGFFLLIQTWTISHFIFIIIIYYYLLLFIINIIIIYLLFFIDIFIH